MLIIYNIPQLIYSECCMNIKYLYSIVSYYLHFTIRETKTECLIVHLCQCSFRASGVWLGEKGAGAGVVGGLQRDWGASHVLCMAHSPTQQILGFFCQSGQKFHPLPLPPWAVGHAANSPAEVLWGGRQGPAQTDLLWARTLLGSSQGAGVGAQIKTLVPQCWRLMGCYCPEQIHWIMLIWFEGEIVFLCHRGQDNGIKFQHSRCRSYFRKTFLSIQNNIIEQSA